MNLKEYQKQTILIWEPNATLEETFLLCCAGMVEESGEAMGKLKRWLRGDGFNKEDYLLELGDVLSYLVMAAYCKGIDVEELGDIQINNKQGEGNELKRLLLHNALLSQHSGHLLEMSILELDSVMDLRSVFIEIKLLIMLMQSSFEEVMKMNLDKLRDRKNRTGTLRGSGDKR